MTTLNNNKTLENLIKELQFKKAVLQKQVAACLREIYRRIKIYVDRLVILEGQIEKVTKMLQECYLQMAMCNTAKANQINPEEWDKQPLANLTSSSIKSYGDKHVTAVEKRHIKAILDSGILSTETEVRANRKLYSFYGVNNKVLLVKIDNSHFHRVTLK